MVGPRRRTVRLGLAVAVLVAVVGCSGKTSTEGYPALQPTPSTVPTVTPVTTPRLPDRGPASVPIVTATEVTSAAPDGRWQVDFRQPVVSGVDAAVARAMNHAIEVRVDGLVADFTTAVAGTTLGPGVVATLKGTYSVALASASILSLRLAVDEYTGGASDELLVGSVNFWLPSGAVIDMGSLFTSAAAALPVLSVQAKALLTESLGSSLIWPASPSLATFEEGWAITPAGLEVSWKQFEVGPGAAGAPTVTIPWSSLAGVIDPSGPAGQFVP